MVLLIQVEKILKKYYDKGQLNIPHKCEDLPVRFRVVIGTKSRSMILVVDKINCFSINHCPSCGDNINKVVKRHLLYITTKDTKSTKVLQ